MINKYWAYYPQDSTFVGIQGQMEAIPYYPAVGREEWELFCSFQLFQEVDNFFSLKA